MPILMYQFLFRVLTPFIRLYIWQRAHMGKEDPVRLPERFGIATETARRAISAAPLWIHAASVGEAGAALSLIDIARGVMPDLPILLTTGTVTSAQMVQKRLPPNTVHQYAPYDHPRWVARFLTTWAPRACIRIESELWPTSCLKTAQFGIPSLLMNAQMSDRSFTRWQRFPRTIRKILSCFDDILADGDDNAQRYRHLGAPHVTSISNLKFIAAPLPVNDQEIAPIAAALSSRPCWLYASTHADEEIIAARTHMALKPKFPNLMTLMALRHPNRLDAVTQALSALPLNIAYRSTARVPAPDTDLYIIDTMGELGTFFKTVPITMMGRSFSLDGGGGHNPIEPALMGSYPLSGPHVQNLKTIYAAMTAGQAAEIVETSNDLIARLDVLLSNRDQTRTHGTRSQQFIMANQQALYQTVESVIHDLLQSVLCLVPLSCGIYSQLR